MASRSNAWMSALASVVRLHPRLSAGLAFELGVMVGAYIKAARGQRGIAGATAKLIDAVPIVSQAAPVRRRSPSRKPAAQRRKPAKRTKAKAKAS